MPSSWSVAADAVAASVVTDPEAEGAPTSLEHVMGTWRDPVSTEDARDAAAVAHAIATRQRVSAALLAIAAARLKHRASHCEPTEESTGHRRPARPLPRAADMIVRATLARPGTVRPPATGNCQAEMAGYARAVADDARSSLVRANVGPAVPPGGQLASLRAQAANAKGNEYLQRRAAARQASRWLANEAALLQDLGVALVLRREEGGAMPKPHDEEGAVALTWPGFFLVTLSCGDGAPQVTSFRSLLRVPGDAPTAVQPEDTAFVRSEATSAFHSRGSVAGLLSLKGAAAGMALDVLTSQAAEAAAARTLVAGRQIRRTAVEVAGPEAGLRIFLGDPQSFSESGMVRFRVDTRLNDVVAEFVKGDGVASRPVMMPPGCARRKSTYRVDLVGNVDLSAWIENTLAMSEV